MNTTTNSTICAVATPPGKGALGIVRLSGPQSISIADNIFFPVKKDKKLQDFPTHTLHYGEVKDNKRPIDDVMVAIMKGPRTYTGEDMIEITCHGGLFILNSVLNVLVKNGARPAEPGEFTKRAFLNGRMDLSQAESVNRLINARSGKTHQEALKLVKGEIKQRVQNIREKIVEAKTAIDADIEWGDTEDIPGINKKKQIKNLVQAEKEIGNILSSSAAEKQMMEGFRVVICGRPNAGKSSLFNRMVESSRSIIHRTPGTTRDVIEKDAVMEGFLIKFIDTAGIGLSKETEVDKIAARKSKNEIESADTIIFVLDQENGIDKKDYEILNMFENKSWFPVLNKIDLKKEVDKQELKNICGKKEYIKISCTKNKGINKLKQKLGELLKEYETDKIMISQRQTRAFSRACDEIRDGIAEIKKRNYLEIVSFQLEQALKYLGEIDGSVIREQDILNRIFDNFCIGK